MTANTLCQRGQDLATKADILAMKADLAELKADLIKWNVGALIATSRHSTEAG